MKKQRKHRTGLIILIIVFVVLVGLLGAGIYIWKNYRITTVYVEGNTHYTDEEVIDYVMGSEFAHNSIIL